MKQIFRRAFGRLPSSAQLELYRMFLKLARPEVLAEFQRMRRKNSSAGYSLKGYDDRKSIFVRIPKCATRSLAVALFGNLGGGHMRMIDYYAAFGRRRFQEYFKFAVVRNPWDRLVSAYFFLQDGGVNAVDEKWAREHLAEYPTFSSFIKGWLSTENVKRGTHFLPQSHYVCGHDGKLLLDYVGRFESIEQGFATIKSRVNPSATLAHFNPTRSRSSDYRKYFDDEMIDIVSTVYRNDIELLGYDFDGSSSTAS